MTITAYLGKVKTECEIQVENNSLLNDCVPILGPFIKFVAHKAEAPCTSTFTEKDCRPDAFQLLMASSRDETKLPKTYDNPQSNDNKL